jgi:hypothetical protein
MPLSSNGIPPRQRRGLRLDAYLCGQGFGHQLTTITEKMARKRSTFRQRLAQQLPMSQPLFYGWLVVAFSAGTVGAITVEVQGRPVGWRFLACVLFTVVPPLFVRWGARSLAPRARTRR